MFIRLLRNHPWFLGIQTIILIGVFYFGFMHPAWTFGFVFMIIIGFMTFKDGNKNYSKNILESTDYGIFLFTILYLIAFAYNYYSFEPYSETKTIENKPYVYDINSKYVDVYFFDKNNKVFKNITMTHEEFDKLNHLKNYKIKIKENYTKFYQLFSIDKIEITSYRNSNETKN